jgi:hypothetical protein
MRLTPERIRELVAEHEDVARRLRSPAGREMLRPPDLATFVSEDAGAGAVSLDAARFMDALTAQIDQRMGPGTGAHVMDMTRLQELLSVLSMGTIEDAIAREKAKVAAMEKLDVPSFLAAQLREHAPAVEARLLDFLGSEVDAVLSSLDVIESAFPAQARLIRVRHREGRAAATTRSGTGASSDDSEPWSSPRLTPARIRRVLELVRELAPTSKKLRVLVADPGVYVGFGESAEKLLGKNPIKELAKRGENADAFVASLVWIKIIAGNLRRTGSIGATLEEVRALADPAAWKMAHLSPAQSARRAEGFASTMTSVGSALERVDAESERAVLECMDEIQAELRSHRVPRAR